MQLISAIDRCALAGGGADVAKTFILRKTVARFIFHISQATESAAFIRDAEIAIAVTEAVSEMYF